MKLRNEAKFFWAFLSIIFLILLPILNWIDSVRQNLRGVPWLRGLLWRPFVEKCDFQAPRFSVSHKFDKLVADSLQDDLIKFFAIFRQLTI